MLKVPPYEDFKKNHKVLAAGECTEKRVEKEHQLWKASAERLEPHGYTRLVEYDQKSEWQFQLRAYHKNGVRIDIINHFQLNAGWNDPTDKRYDRYLSTVFKVYVKKHGRYVEHYFGHPNTIDKAIEYASEQKEIKRPKRDALQWRKPAKENVVEHKKGLLIRSSITFARHEGYCRITPEGSIDFDLTDPKSRPYFYIYAEDKRSRKLYFIMKDTDSYLLALPRGNKATITYDSVLFNKHELTPEQDITTDDMKFLAKTLGSYYEKHDV